jgi:hypothetical protein
MRVLSLLLQTNRPSKCTRTFKKPNVREKVEFKKEHCRALVFLHDYFMTQHIVVILLLCNRSICIWYCILHCLT